MTGLELLEMDKRDIETWKLILPTASENNPKATYKGKEFFIWGACWEERLILLNEEKWSLENYDEDNECTFWVRAENVENIEAN